MNYLNEFPIRLGRKQTRLGIVPRQSASTANYGIEKKYDWFVKEDPVV